MKKIIILAAVMGMGAILGACGVLGGNDTNKTEGTTVNDTANEKEADITEELVTDATTTTTEDDLHITKEQQNMLPVMDALVMCMEENSYSYDSTNPEFYWSALFYVTNQCGLEREGNGVTSDGVEGIMKVYYRVVQEFATATFADYTDLMDIPDGVEYVKLNPDDNEEYWFNMGDRGNIASKIVSWETESDGSQTVVTQIYDSVDDEVIAEYKFVLVDNTYADGVSSPTFIYSVKSAEKIK